MAKPKQVRIGAHRHRINYRDGITTDDGQSLTGRISFTNGDIDLHARGGEAPMRMAETFLHEAVHGISWDRAIGLDERQTDQVASGLFQLIVDNPKIFGTTFLEQWKS